MKKTRIAMAVIVITAIIAFILIALVSGIGFILERLRWVLGALDPQVGIVLGVSSIVALLCAWLIAGAIRSAIRRNLDGRKHSQLAAGYQVLIKSLAEQLAVRPKARSTGMTGFVGLLTPEHTMFLHGDVAVNKEYRALMHLWCDPEADEEVVRSQITRLLLAMRRDCGSPTHGLEGEDWTFLLRTPPAIQEPPAKGSPVRANHVRVRLGAADFGS